MLILHIGLPKTGSTFLQRDIFPNFQGLTTLHKATPPMSLLGRIGPQLITVQKNLIRSRSSFLSWLGQWILVLIQNNRKVLFSSENLSLRPKGIWDGIGVGPNFYAQYLPSLKQKMGGSRLIVILGIRRWDTWLASRYAQSAGSFPDAGQTDFENRVLEILNVRFGNPNGPLGWLEYDSAIDMLCRAIGKENVLVYRQEDLDSDCVGFITKLSEMIDCKFDVSKLDSFSGSAAVAKRNQRAISSSTWKLNRSDKSITLDYWLQNLILEKFSSKSRLYWK